MRQILLLLTLTLAYIGQAQISFEESAATMGVDETYGLSNLGGGVSFHDFDGDGWDDITYATSKNKEILFYKNTGGSFEQVDLGIENLYETKQVLWVDYDNDGDKDLFVTSITGFNKFYENDGNMKFTDISASCGLFTENLYTYGATFGDIDNDGDLDLYIVNRDVTTLNQYNYLYVNNDGLFTDITVSAGLDLGNDLSFCASFFDYDNDGDQDIYVSNDKYSKINRLYRNNGDLTFEDVSITSGAGMAIDAMSTTIGDYNGDGWWDIYVTNTYEGNYHLRNNADGTFTNVAAEIGTTMYSIGWGAVFLDVDNDTDLDLYVSDGTMALSPSVLYENENGLYTIPENIGFGFDTRQSYGNAIGDIDNNGLPDILVMNDTFDNYLWRNNTANSNNWIKVKLIGSISNRDGIGSTIEVFSNGKSQYRYTLCGEGYLGQNSGYEFFGLSEATSIDYIKVSWLSGIVDTITEVGVNRSLTLLEGSGIMEEQIAESGETEQNPEEAEEEQGDNDVNAAEFECSASELLVFPNPSESGYFSFCTDFNGLAYTVDIFDLKGRRVGSQAITAAEPTLNLSYLESGMYLARFEANNRVFFKKILRR